MFSPSFSSSAHRSPRQKAEDKKQAQIRAAKSAQARAAQQAAAEKAKVEADKAYAALPFVKPHEPVEDVRLYKGTGHCPFDTENKCFGVHDADESLFHFLQKDGSPIDLDEIINDDYRYFFRQLYFVAGDDWPVRKPNWGLFGSPIDDLMEFLKTCVRILNACVDGTDMAKDVEAIKRIKGDKHNKIPFEKFVGALQSCSTDAGMKDMLLGTCPDNFKAFVLAGNTDVKEEWKMRVIEKINWPGHPEASRALLDSYKQLVHCILLIAQA